MKLFTAFMRNSTKAYLAEAKQSPSYSLKDWIHGYIYGRWIYLYIAVGTGEHRLAKIFSPFFHLFLRVIHYFSAKKSGKNIQKTSLSDSYHGKVIPSQEAKKLVVLNREIRIVDLEKIVPDQRARSIILKNPDHIVALQCPCRAARKNPCYPLEVCLIIGEPFASFVNEHHPEKSRFITGDEALQIIDQEHGRGHVQHAFFKDAMLDRFYAICNCCGCCCGAIEAVNNGIPMLASSGYVAQVDINQCVQCQACMPSCQFEAIGWTGETITIERERCFGCGVCVSNGPQDAISLLRDENKGIPLEIEELMTKATTIKI